MNKHPKLNIWLITAGAFFAFFVFGFSDNLKGPTLPALLADLHINYALGGTILFGTYVGFIIASLTTGLLADWAGKKAVILVAGLSLALGVGGYSSFSSPLLLTLSMGFLGFGLGGLELGANAIIVEVHHANKGRYLNLMSVFHGMGSMVAPLIAGWLLTAGISWRSVYRWDYVLIVVMVVYFIFLRYPKSAQTESERLDFKKIGKTAFRGPILWLYVAIAVYVATELGISSWIVTFLQNARGQNVEQSTQALALYFGVIMLGRFVGSFIVDRVGHLRSILFAALGASAMIAIGLFGPSGLAICLPLSGFFLSIIFPTITAAVSDLHRENTSTILGLLFTFAGVGGMIGPWLVGINSDLFGIQAGFATNLAYGILTALSVLGLMRMTSKAQEQPAA
jgi:FHS family glucose/mannose:H+ symporter-like MFS transporter